MSFIFGMFFGVLCMFLISLIFSTNETDECKHEFGDWYEYSISTQQRECELCGYIQKKEKGK